VISGPVYASLSEGRRREVGRRLCIYTARFAAAEQRRLLYASTYTYTIRASICDTNTAFLRLGMSRALY